MCATDALLARTWCAGLLQEFFLEVREVDRDNEVNRILGAFKLNPFEQMGLRFDTTHEEAKRQYRKISLMIHPDKCKHPLATSAFEVLGNANQQLQDEEAVRELRHVLNLARGTCLPCHPHSLPGLLFMQSVKSPRFHDGVGLFLRKLFCLRGQTRCARSARRARRTTRLCGWPVSYMR